jgi:hypothetical protein
MRFFLVQIPIQGKKTGKEMDERETEKEEEKEAGDEKKSIKIDTLGTDRVVGRNHASSVAGICSFSF